MRALWTAIAAGWAMWSATASAQALPPFVQAYNPQGVDERGLWMEADEEERVLRDSRFVITDLKLNAYVRSIFCRTVGDDRCKNVRIYILRIPHLNATMYPNGMMTIWSGLLLRVRSEAELGAVLGHEFAHFELRHSLKGFQAQRSTGDWLTWTALLGVNMQSAMIGSFYSFTRDQEKQADLLGLEYLAKSVYPSSVAANIWDRTMAEQDAAEAGRKRKARHSYSAGIFASHPTDLTRSKYLREAAAKQADAGDPGEAAYREGMASWLPEFLHDQIKLNDFGGSEYLLQQLAGDNWTSELLYTRAQLYRLRGNPRDLVSAAQFYQQAIDKGFSRADARRDLGLTLLRAQQIESGRMALQRYLDENPEAPDKAMIAALLAD